MEIIILLVCPNVDKFHKEMLPIYLFFKLGQDIVMIDEPDLDYVRYARDLNPTHPLQVCWVPCYICKSKGVLGLTHFQNWEEVITSP
jgi:hypothetical protein